jgi:hypothetical protein
LYLKVSSMNDEVRMSLVIGTWDLFGTWVLGIGIYAAARSFQ